MILKGYSSLSLTLSSERIPELTTSSISPVPLQTVYDKSRLLTYRLIYCMERSTALYLTRKSAFVFYLIKHSINTLDEHVKHALFSDSSTRSNRTGSLILTPRKTAKTCTLRPKSHFFGQGRCKEAPGDTLRARSLDTRAKGIRCN